MNPDTWGQDERKESAIPTLWQQSWEAHSSGRWRLLCLSLGWWWCSRRVGVRWIRTKAFLFFFTQTLPSFSDSVTLNWGSEWMDVFSGGNGYPGVMPLAFFLMPWVLSKSWVKGQEYISLKAWERSIQPGTATHGCTLEALTGITVYTAGKCRPDVFSCVLTSGEMNPATQSLFKSCSFYCIYFLKIKKRAGEGLYHCILFPLCYQFSCSEIKWDNAIN